jgi:ABC-type branched-subunit amino acid transport system substrate-binding protein
MVTEKCRTSVVVAVAAALSVLLGACGTTAPAHQSSGQPTGPYTPIPPGPIKLGVNVSLSGVLATAGLSNAGNFKDLVNLQNEHGGIDGHRIELIVLNDQDSTTIAATNARSLVQDGIVASLFPGFSGIENITTPIFNENHICTVWPIDSDQWLNAAEYPCFYTVEDLGRIENEAVAKYAATKNLTKIGVIYDSLPLDQTGFSDFQAAAAENGLTITKAVEIPVTAVDATVQISELKASGAQAIYVEGVGTAATEFKALQTEGWSGPILTEYPQITLAYSSLASLAAQIEYSCAQALPSGTQPTAYMKEIANIARPNSPPGTPFYGEVAQTADDPLLLLVYAISKFHSTDYKAIMTAIDSAKNVTLSSPFWKYTFSATQHDGLPQAEEHMCSVSTPPVDGYPVYNWTYGGA